MKKYLAILLLLTATLSGTVYKNLNINGAANLKDSEIVGHALINGALRATNVTFGSLSANGSCQFENVYVVGKTQVNGYLEAKNSRFKDEISVASNTTILEDCEVHSIRVQKSTNSPQKVILRGTTQVEGEILFEGKGGEVIYEK